MSRQAVAYRCFRCSSPHIICYEPNGGVSWNADGTILYATHGGFQIKQIPASGDMPRQLVSPMLSPGQAHVHPQFLPDGRRYLFFAA